MSTDTKTCYIYSEDSSLASVLLPDNLPIFVGRSLDTKITDTQCSRRQVRLYASYADKKVFVEQIGSRSCGLNGFKTEKGVKVVAGHGDRLEMLYGKHAYRFEFNPPPETESAHVKVKKRMHSTDTECDEHLLSNSNSKRSKTEVDHSDQDEDELMEACKNNGNDLSSPGCSKDVTRTDNINNCSSDVTDTDIWEDFDNKKLFVFTSKGVQGRSKIAAYDMDRTLIKTQSGLQFPKDYNDWQILYSEVPGKLKKLYADNYKIVIFSNQAGLHTGKTSVKEFKIKIERIVKRLGIPIQVFIAAGQDMYRKPRTGMWNFLVTKKNQNVPVNKSDSFYVGDAAGRPANPSFKLKKDHSLADRLFASNLNLTFYTPEEHFLGHKTASYNPPIFNPKDAINANTNLLDNPDANITSPNQEVIIMVGSPGSGKSHFAKAYLSNYSYINRDMTRSWQKCVSKADEMLGRGQSIVIDNTNPDPVSRQRYIEIAKKHKVPVRCFVMALKTEHVKHNNVFRILTDSSHEKISDIIINSYAKNYKQPELKEGISEIVKINFVPKFTSTEDKSLYEMYLLDK